MHEECAYCKGNQLSFSNMWKIFTKVFIFISSHPIESDSDRPAIASLHPGRLYQQRFHTIHNYVDIWMDKWVYVMGCNHGKNIVHDIATGQTVPPPRHGKSRPTPTLQCGSRWASSYIVNLTRHAQPDPNH